MDLNTAKPKHIVALFLMLLTVLLNFILPSLAILSTDTTTSSIPTLNALEEFVLFSIQVGSVILTLLLIPIIWYILVNEYNIEQILSHIKLKKTNIAHSAVYGFVFTILMVIVLSIFGLILPYLGITLGDEAGNLQELTTLFSPIYLFLLVLGQPLIEEFFFRGFLYDKLENKGPIIAILITSILFGFIHIGYGKPIPVLTGMLTGVILGYELHKTKSLLAPIITHTLYNLSALVAYLFLV